MSAEILAAPAELRDHASRVRGQSEATTNDFNSMRSQLDSLSSAFKGQAATAFDTHFQDWHTHANGLIQALDGLGQFLSQSADAIEQVDQQLASGLGS